MNERQRSIIEKTLDNKKKDFMDKPIGFKRTIFDQAYKSLDMPNITIITGLRRVGKTTLMRQLFDKLVNNKVHISNLHFFSFDDHITRNIQFLDQLLETVTHNIENKTYIFLDEVQYIQNWQGTVKKYTDFHQKIKVIISGSSSLFIKKKMNESLAGRTYEIKLEKLSFHEYLQICEKTSIEHYDLKSFITKTDTETAEKIIDFWAKNDQDIINLFKKYLLIGEFPETREYTTLEDKYKYINEGIYKKLIEEDLPYVYNIQNVPEFRRLFDIFISETANYLEITNLTREVEIAKNTIKHYLYALQEGFLLGDMVSFRKSIRKRARAKQKVYIAASNFYTAYHNIQHDFDVHSVLGHLLETNIYWLLDKTFNYNFFYYRNQQEIDFISTDDPLLKKIYPIEVKYKTDITRSDYSFMANYMKNKGIRNGFVLSLDAKHVKARDQKIWVLPAPLFL